MGGVLAGTALQQRLPTRAIAGGIALSNLLPERTLDISFAMLQLDVALRLARRAVRDHREETA